MSLLVSPFDEERLIGSVVECTPTTVKVNLPLASRPHGKVLYGNRYGAGEVGEYVCIHTERFVVLGRMNQIRLPERERLSVEPTMEPRTDSHPIGWVQMLCSINIETHEVTPGITQFPRIGATVYTAHPDLLSAVAAFSKPGSSSPLTLEIATLAKDPDTYVKITPEKLFGRHSAVLGATGGGKSWTVARIIESLSKSKAKLILLDATGEYHTARFFVKHVHLGGTQPPATSEEVVLPYENLSIHDLIAMFRPGGQAQAPKLRTAMKTLKLLRLEPSLGTNGTFIKANQPKTAFMAKYQARIDQVDSDAAEFDINKLTQQVEYECCYLTGTTPNSWGAQNGNEVGYVSGLVGRIGSMVSAPEFACIFKPGTKKPLFDAIRTFLVDPHDRVLRISLRDVSFASDARQIVANTIGKFLLRECRAGSFLGGPVVVILDEAHNFINRTVGDEFSKEHLDAFELIAREGRKFCLTICLATQRPRDLPESVLSQMGTLVVHRLTNYSDREVVEKASGDIDKSAASFLPTLAPGEAILIGTDFAFPVAIKMIPPTFAPDSGGPDYQTLWQ
jgi:hypothetical protein